VKRLLLLLFFASSAFAQTKVVTLPTSSPIVNIRIVFKAGSAVDPPDKLGLANLTAAMIARGGTRDLSYKQIVDQMFPMATSVDDQVDEEMTTFSGTTHVDNLAAYYKLFRAMLLEPGWRQEDLDRLKSQATNALLVGLRGNNDEELGKEILYAELYRGTPYGHDHLGTHSGIEQITLDDVKSFYRQHYAQSDVIIGLAGGYPATFADEVKKDLSTLPQKETGVILGPMKPAPIAHSRVTLVQKNSDSIAISLGFPMDVKRGDPDYPALLLAQSYFGPHRLSSGRLFQRIREIRGINYGDYAYIEYFPRGMFQFEPSPNLARRSQIFQIWIRPVQPADANFTLRLALYELTNFIHGGIPAADFQATKDFASKYVNVLTKTKDDELGYAIDSAYYGIPDYNDYVRSQVAKLTLDQVNAAIGRHLHADRLQIVAIANGVDSLKEQLTSNEPATIHYNSPKAGDILSEDKIVGKFDLGLRPQDVEIVPADKEFE
jgi:zinc protease